MAAGDVKPDHVPDKFWNTETGEVRVDDLAKSYGELERNAGKPANEPATAPAGNGETANAFSVMNALVSKAEITDEDLKTVEAAGGDREFFKRFHTAERARTQSFDDHIAAEAGGREEMATLVKWAAEGGYQDNERDDFNAAINSNDKARASSAVKNLRARHQAANGRSPYLINGNSPADSGAIPLATQEDLLKAQRDPKYRIDPTYRKLVEAGLRAARARRA